LKKEAEEKAKKYGVEYVETSAKLNKNVDYAFNLLAKAIINRFLKE